MTLIFKYLIEFGLILYNVITAKINSDMEKNDLKNGTSGSIKHGWWGLAYLVLAGAAWYFTGMNWFVLAASLFQRKLVFDISYNLFQPRSWYFTDKNSTAIVDKLYNWLFQYNAKLYQIFNLIVFSILQIWI